jgi:hypothetical protein
VVVFSSDPRLVESLPGYVETSALDLTNATDDFESLLDLNLPAGVTAVNDSKVLVQVSIAAIESSLTVSLPVEITGLSPAFIAQVAPATVDLIVTGPVPILSDLKPSNIRITVDLTGFQVGVHQVIPELAFLPPSLQKVSILPTTVEVSITLAPTKTPTPRGFIATTPSASVTPTPLDAGAEGKIMSSQLSPWLTPQCGKSTPQPPVESAWRSSTIFLNHSRLLDGRS